MEEKTDTGSAPIETAENTTAAAKKPTKAKSKAQRPKKSSHPPTSEMVTAAIKELKDRKGSSLQAIKKYISTTYKVDGEKVAPFIKRYLKSAITSGAVVQTKGKGASGSFKLSSGKPSAAEKAKTIPRAVKKTAPKRAQSVEKKTVSKKATPTKKPATTKKAAVQKKAATPKKTAAKPVPAKSKSSGEIKTMSKSKSKKTAKAPAAKTKAPKPKKAAASKSVKSAAKK